MESVDRIGEKGTCGSHGAVWCRMAAEGYAQNMRRFLIHVQMCREYMKIRIPALKVCHEIRKYLLCQLPIRQGKQEKLFHEVIFQIGNKDDMNVRSEEGQLALPLYPCDKIPHCHGFFLYLHSLLKMLLYCDSQSLSPSFR